ncbi:MAG: 3-dehydroquinate synthase [Chlamydiae bacterium]|nr:3-dehydroquinate synthase [Chlamydiota bacterium]
MKQLVIRPITHPVSIPLYLGSGLLQSPLIKEILPKGPSKIVIVTDPSIKDLYAADLAKDLDAVLVTLPSGPIIKTQATATYLIDELFRIGAGRDTTLIAIGGGMTTDVVSFVASIYMRGIPLILIPTTLLSMVDAAIGGKTGIDTPLGKNLLGTIYHPQAIFSDLDTLKTLPKEEWVNGLAEILKIGLIYDPSIFYQALENIKEQGLILKAIEAKIAIIQQDPTEQSLRRILNFGHTIGHALERISEYAMPHGQAVAIGCVAEAYLSLHLGYLSSQDFAQIHGMYQMLPLQLPSAYTRSKLFESMTYDKKKASGKIRFVLIDRIGHAIPFTGEYCAAVAHEKLGSTLDWMERSFA